MSSMPTEFVVWLLAFLLVMALVALTLYSWMCFSDLANDYQNPLDCAQNVNRFVMFELVCQVYLLGYLLFWHSGLGVLVNLPMSYLHVRRFLKGGSKVEPNEVVVIMEERKRECYWKLAMYLLSLYALTGFVSRVVHPEEGWSEGWE